MKFNSKARSCFSLEDSAEKAANFHASVLPESEIEAVNRPEPNGPARVVEFTIAGAPYMTMNGNPDFQSNYASIETID